MALLASGMLLMPLLALAAPATVPSLTPVPPTGERTLTLAPYEITYRIRLKDVSERSGIIIASGSLFSRLSGGRCAGWTSNSRMRVRFVFERRGARETESHVISWESDDGNEYHSLIRRFLNGRRVESIRVNVFRSRTGEPFTLHMLEPERLTRTLPPETLFSNTALKRILRAAHEGTRHLSLLIYEGDREAAPQRVAVIIGRRQQPAQDGAEGQARKESPALEEGTARPGNGKATGKGAEAASGLAWLRRQPYWPVSLAYYGIVGQEERASGKQGREADSAAEERRFGLPEYEVHFRLYENGVAGDAILIYPEYVLEAKVESLRFLPPDTCE